MNRLAIFDCDGTLVDSQAAIVSSLGDAFTEHGLPVPCSREARRVVGLSLPQAMAALLPEADASQHLALAESYKRCFQGRRNAGQVSECLYPGIAELLRELEDAGWLLAVATGKSDRGLRHCLETNGIAARFCSLQTADRHPSKPDAAMALAAMAEAGAAPETSMVIGDTCFDMAMARAAGIVAVGVDWGYHQADELLASGAVLVASDPAEIAAYASRWPDPARD